MQTLTAIKTRRSIRKFIDKKVPKRIVGKILLAGTHAPSGCNCQPWRFIVIAKNPKTRTFNPGCHYPWVENAPNMIIICIDPHDTFKVQNEEATDHILDTAAAIQNMLLAIHDLGLGGVWVTGFDRLAVRKALNIPKHWLINSIIPFGYYRSADHVEYRGKNGPIIKKRSIKPLSEVAFYGNIKRKFK